MLVLQTLLPTSQPEIQKRNFENAFWWWCPLHRCQHLCSSGLTARQATRKYWSRDWRSLWNRVWPTTVTTCYISCKIQYKVPKRKVYVWLAPFFLSYQNWCISIMCSISINFLRMFEFAKFTD
jgi:hypothetical protein